MKAAELASEVSAEVCRSFSIGQPVRIRHGMLSWVLRNAHCTAYIWACTG